MISFIICALNEEKNILNTLQEVKKTNIDNKIFDYEIICVDDGSKDQTNSILREYQDQNKEINIKIVKNKKNLGYGASVKIGSTYASNEFITWIPGDNSHPSSEISKLIFLIGKYDIISTFYSNSHERDPKRKYFTSFYTPILNFIFQKKLPYYNGVTIIRTNIFKECNIQTNSHAFSLEMWMKIFLSKKYSFIFVPTLLKDRIDGASAFKFINSVKVIFTTIKLIFYYLYKRYFKIY
jgi:glycosyltransferase involved in cell wall biosynthesis